MSFSPKSAPRLDSFSRLRSQEVIHSPAAPAQQRYQLLSLLFVETVRIDEHAEPVIGVRTLMGWVGGQRDEAVNRIGQIPEPGAGRRAVPIDEGPSIRWPMNQVPGGEVVVDDEVVAIGRNEHIPVCGGWRDKAFSRDMERSDQVRYTGQSGRGV